MARVSKDEYIERITPFLTSHGINDFHFEKLARHRAVTISYDGRLYRVVFPLTGSDWRGPANTISTIRHVLGVFKEKAPQLDGAKSRRRRKKAAHRLQSAMPTYSPTPATQQPDKFIGPLMILKARLEEAGAKDRQSAESTPSAVKRSRICLRTPWLGKRPRYVSI